MEDNLDSFSDLEEVIGVIVEVTQLLKLGRFKSTTLTSNNS